MTDPRAIDLFAVDAVCHDPGVFDREAEVAGTRWALVEYSPGLGRRDWCDTPHAGYHCWASVNRKSAPQSITITSAGSWSTSAAEAPWGRARKTTP